MKSIAGRPLSVLFSLVWILILSFALTVINVGCLDEGRGREGDTEIVAEPNPEEDVPPPLTTPERTVCDPFDAGVTARDRGLVAELFYLNPDQPRYSSSLDYLEHGQKIASTLYLDRLFIPTRAFDLGFYTQEGNLVVNSEGESLYENFALRLESDLALAENEEEGWYQLATLSDDGSLLDIIHEDGSIENLIDNDGNHPTRMGCAIRSIYMTKETRKRVVMAYHQGPRYHIALILMWRPLPDGADPAQPVSDVDCGREGNSRYFNSNFVPSVPTLKYYELLERQWKVLTNENYRFPFQESNPCAEEEPLVLSNFSIISATRDRISVSWSTTLAATSMIRVTNTSTGAIMESPVDSQLKRSHSVSLTGLTANTLYTVQAISETSLGQKAESEEVAFRTPR
jgi:hypothetical protein